MLDIPRYEQEPNSNSAGEVLSFGIAMLVAGAALGALTALLLSTKPEITVSGASIDRLSEWKSQAANTLAKAREKVVSTIEGRDPVDGLKS